MKIIHAKVIQSLSLMLLCILANTCWGISAVSCDGYVYCGSKELIGAKIGAKIGDCTYSSQPTEEYGIFRTDDKFVKQCVQRQLKK